MVFIKSWREHDLTTFRQRDLAKNTLLNLKIAQKVIFLAKRNEKCTQYVWGYIGFIFSSNLLYIIFLNFFPIFFIQISKLFSKIFHSNFQTFFSKLFFSPPPPNFRQLGGRFSRESILGALSQAPPLFLDFEKIWKKV